MRSAIRYGLLKAVPLSSKALLLAFCPRILYATIEPHAANASVFLLSTLGYLTLISPGRDLVAVQSFHRSSFKKVENSLLPIQQLLKYLYLLLAPALIYVAVILNLIDSRLVQSLLISVSLLSILDNYLLPYKAAAHICADPERAYLLQSFFSLPSAVILLYVSSDALRPSSLFLLAIAFGAYFLGQLLSSLFMRRMVLAYQTKNSPASAPPHEGASPGSKAVRYLPKKQAFYIRAAPVLTMLSFGFLPYYYYFISGQAPYQQLMMLYPLFMLPSSAVGSLYFPRMHAAMRIKYLAGEIRGLKRYSSRLALLFVLSNFVGALLVLGYVSVSSMEYLYNSFPLFAFLSSLNGPVIILGALLVSVDCASKLVNSLAISFASALLVVVTLFIREAQLSLTAYLTFMSAILIIFIVSATFGLFRAYPNHLD